MKRITKTVIAAALICSIVLLCSCSDRKGASGGGKFDLSSYPIKTNLELTMWMELPSSTSAVCSNFGETQFAQEWAKRTGVKINFVHPALGQESEAFGLMVASDDMTDIIKYDWTLALGGPSTTIADNVIIPLNDLIKNYAPNLKKFLESREDIAKEIMTDNGQYYMFPFIRNDKSLLVSQGFIIRRDWLEECGLKMPEVVEELEQALSKFRSVKGAKAPLSITKTNIGALFKLFSANHNFYIDNDVVKYGPCEPEFKIALEKLNKWFDEGLLDKNFVSADQALVNSNILNGNTGLSYGSGGGQLGQWIDSANSSGINLDIVGMPGMAETKGGMPRFTNANSTVATNGSTAISTSCKYPELAAKVLDYGYSEEGSMFFNFGTEGVSYNMVDGYPKYTDTIMNNSEKLSVTQAMGQYILGHSNGPFIQDKRYIEQYYSKPQQKEALKRWEFGVDESASKRVPILLYTTEEAEERSRLLTDIEKYRDEMIAAVISGFVSLNNYDKYLEKLNSLGVQRLIKITQDAYDRYKDRK